MITDATRMLAAVQGATLAAGVSQVSVSVHAFEFDQYEQLVGSIGGALGISPRIYSGVNGGVYARFDDDGTLPAIDVHYIRRSDADGSEAIDD